MKENLKIKELLKNFTLKRSTSALIKKPSKSITTTNSTLISNSKRKKIFCYSCKDRESTTFCLLCGKTFCKSCDNQIHLNPSLSSHSRTSIINVYHFKKFCSTHDKPLTLFCESCNEITCESCSNEGTHSNKLHNTVPITESYIKKFKHLNEFVTKDLMRKHEQLLKQIKLIDGLTQKLTTNKNELEKEIKDEYSRILENLKREEGKKLSVLTRESIIFQKEINKINDIAIFLKEMDNNSPDLIKFMQCYKDHFETAEKCFVKEIKRDTTLDVDDLPRELDKRRKRLAFLKKMDQLVKVKDDIIWNLILDKKKARDEEISIMNQKHLKEITELKKSNFTFLEEIKKLTLICTFCGEFLNDENINYLCTKNSNMMPNEILYKTYIPKHAYNNKRHYFVRPNTESPNKREFIDREKFNSCHENDGNLLSIKEQIFNRPNSTACTSGNNFYNSSSSFLKKENFDNVDPNKELQKSNLDLKENGFYDDIIEKIKIETFLGEKEVYKIFEKIRTFASKQGSNVYELFSNSFNEFANVEMNVLKEFFKRKLNLDDFEEKVMMSFFRNNFISSLHSNDSNMTKCINYKDINASMENKIAMSRVYSFLRIRKFNCNPQIQSNKSALFNNTNNESDNLIGNKIKNKDINIKNNILGTRYNRISSCDSASRSIIEDSRENSVFKNENIYKNDHNNKSEQINNESYNNLVPIKSKSLSSIVTQNPLIKDENNNAYCDQMNKHKTKRRRSMNNNEQPNSNQSKNSIGIVDWIKKIVCEIENKHINLYSILSTSDIDNDEMITCNDLKVAFIRLNLNLSTNDINSMVKFFGFEEDEKINIKEFALNFMNYKNFIK